MFLSCVRICTSALIFKSILVHQRNQMLFCSNKSLSQFGLSRIVGNIFVAQFKSKSSRIRRFSGKSCCSFDSSYDLESLSNVISVFSLNISTGSLLMLQHPNTKIPKKFSSTFKFFFLKKLLHRIITHPLSHTHCITEQSENEKKSHILLRLVRRCQYRT